MLVLLLGATMLLMFLAFGSVVLPVKAAVMSASRWDPRWES